MPYSVRSNDDKSAIKSEESEFVSESGVQIKRIILPGFLVIADIERLSEDRIPREVRIMIRRNEMKAFAFLGNA